MKYRITVNNAVGTGLFDVARAHDSFPESYPLGRHPRGEARQEALQIKEPIDTYQSTVND